MQRRVALGILAFGLAALAAVVLAEVLQTLVFAITVAYVLYPARQRLVERGFSRRAAGGAVTTGAVVGVIAALAPIGFVLYERREELLGLLQEVPDEIPVVVGEVGFVVETGPVLEAAGRFVRDAAIAAAGAAPVLALKFTLFVIVIYGLLSRPTAVRTAVLGLVPVDYHDVVAALHRRSRETLAGIYVLQAATALATAVVAFLVFAGLGYPAAVTLAVIAGVLQFVPIVGPSLLVIALAAGDLLGGDPTRAALVLLFGLPLVGFLPDAVIRPRFANVAAHLPMTLYFVGFVGGVLTVGALGFVLGPLVVALLVEAVDLLSAEHEAAPATG